MIGDPGPHRPHQAEVIGDASCVRQQFGDLGPTFSPWSELPLAVENFRTGLRGIVVLDLSREGLHVPLGHDGLGVEEVVVAGPALHPQRDHRLGARFTDGPLGQSVEVSGFEFRSCRRGLQLFLLGQPGGCQGAEAERPRGQEVAAGVGDA